MFCSGKLSISSRLGGIYIFFQKRGDVKFGIMKNCHFFLGENPNLTQICIYGRFFFGDFPLIAALLVWFFFVGIFNDPMCETAMDLIVSSASTILQLPDRQMTSDEMRRSPKILFHRPAAVLETSGDGAILFHVIDKGICT